MTHLLSFISFMVYKRAKLLTSKEVGIVEAHIRTSFIGRHMDLDKRTKKIWQAG